MPSDPTQTSAIEEARAGTSYIIQGPPGTGKSQTITNLIADYVARGKRVLFVCEKCAAIDVVYARLCQCGLGDLCCLIHDSQTDKKGFVMDLKQTYEGLLNAADLPTGSDAATAGNNPRSDLLRRLKNELRPLEQFDAAMQGSPQHVGIPLRNLLRRGIELCGELPELSSLERERLPDYATWWRHRERIASLSAIVEDIRSDGILAKHPLRRLSPRMTQVDRPLELITGVIQAVENHFAAIEASLGRAACRASSGKRWLRPDCLWTTASKYCPLRGLGEWTSWTEPASLTTVCRSRRAFLPPGGGFGRGPAGNGGLAEENSRGGGASRPGAGEGVRAELPGMVEARLVALAANSKRFL